MPQAKKIGDFEIEMEESAGSDVAAVQRVTGWSAAREPACTQALHAHGAANG